MYDLRIVVEEIRGFCDLPVKVGDYFEVKGGRLLIPEGGHACIWALQSMMPLLPVKQRRIAEENDWIPHTSRICCPDPNGQVIYRIEQVTKVERGSEGEPGAESRQSAGSEQSAHGGRDEVAVAAAIAASVLPRMLVNAKACAGCRACELTCSFAHTGQFSEVASRIMVRKDDAAGTDEPVVCRQCGVARCVEACPEDALSRDPLTKAVILDRQRCTSCGRCAAACPFGVVRLVEVTEVEEAEEERGGPRAMLSGLGQRFPLICDLCGGDPQCVQRCPTGAIRYGTAGLSQVQRA